MRLCIGSSEEVAGQRHLPQRPACGEGRSQSCEDPGVNAFQAEERQYQGPQWGAGWVVFLGLGNKKKSHRVWDPVSEVENGTREGQEVSRDRLQRLGVGFSSRGDGCHWQASSKGVTSSGSTGTLPDVVSRRGEAQSHQVSPTITQAHPSHVPEARCLLGVLTDS